MESSQSLLLFELIQVALGVRTSLSRTPSEEEWYLLYKMSISQAVVGLTFEGVRKLGEQNHIMKPPYGLLIEWLGVSEQIKKRNKFVDSRCVDLIKFFTKAGFCSCILKGQGNALMYSNPLCRIPGDIDVWLVSQNRKCNSTKTIIDIVKRCNPTSSARYHHIDYGNFNGVEVEVHYRPMYMFNPIHNNRLQKWFIDHQEEQMKNQVPLFDSDLGIPVPTVNFNRVYQLTHISCHFFIEGVGLRQLLDYYYVLQYPVTENQRKLDEKNLRYLGLYDMAAAVMYVLKKVFDLKYEQMIVPADVKRGEFLLDEVMMAGNLGAYDIRLGQNNSQLIRNLKRLKRNIRLMRYFPSECLWEPVFRAYHFFWRLRYN